MRVEIEINNKLFEIAKKYKLETGLLFDKIIYLKLIKSSYEVFTDICLLHLLETMIADGLITIYNEKYISTGLGDMLIKDVNVLSKGKTSLLDTSGDTISDDFIKAYLNLFKDDEGRYIKKSNKATLGSSSSVIKSKFLVFFKHHGSFLEIERKKNNIKTSLTDIVLEVTKDYVERHSKASNYQFCRKANFFIAKEETSKIVISDLLELVEEYISSPPILKITKQNNMFNVDL